jgi:tight adherence protein B
LTGTGILPLLLGAAAGGLGALAAREAVLATPALASWVQAAIEPLARAGREGYLPSGVERRRLALLGGAGAILGGWLAGGPSLAIPLTIAAPALAASAISRRRNRYRRSVEVSLPEVARAVADSLTAGRSLRAALAAAAESLDGAAAAEMSRLGAELELGAPTPAALAGLRARVGSERVDSFCAALLSQRLAGGDLAGLLRRFAEGAAERDRVMEDARTATAQARFTGLLVVAMPAGAALFAELLEPGFFVRLSASPPALAMIALSAGLQLAGFAAIRRLSRIAG